MHRVLFSISSALFFVFLALPMSVRAAQPDESARTSGVETCADAIEREVRPLLEGAPHRSHDFVAPNKKEIDKRPFYSMAFRSYTDVGAAHISVVATRSDLSRRKTKCDIHITETFLSPQTCEELSGDLSARNFRAAPLASDITLMQNEGAQSIFSFYYLTSTPDGDGCLVSRRRMVYEQ